MKITLRTADNIDNEVIEELREKLHRFFGCPIDVIPGFSSVDHAYNLKRRQYLASALLNQMISLHVDGEEKLLGIVNVDLYAPRLNYVFGEADLMSNVAIISLHRLKQEYYGLPADKVLFLNRAVKEAIHELGHTFGLGHCQDNMCVMHFSNTLADTDQKQAVFCSQCRPKLIK